MIILPSNSFIVEVDEIKETTAAGIYLGNVEKKEPNTGIIIFTGENLSEYNGKRVCFNPNFGTDVELPTGVIRKCFKDFDASVYYIIK